MTYQPINPIEKILDNAYKQTGHDPLSMTAALKLGAYEAHNTIWTKDLVRISNKRAPPEIKKSWKAVEVFLKGKTPNETDLVEAIGNDILDRDQLHKGYKNLSKSEKSDIKNKLQVDKEGYIPFTLEPLFNWGILKPHVIKTHVEPPRKTDPPNAYHIAPTWAPYVIQYVDEFEHKHPEKLSELENIITK